MILISLIHILLSLILNEKKKLHNQKILVHEQNVYNNFLIYIYKVTVTYFYLGDGFQQVPSYLVCGSQMDL